MKNPAYFFHKGIFNPRLLKSKGLWRYTQERAVFDVLLRVKDFTKLNKKQQSKLIAFIKKKFSDDSSMLEHYNKEFGVPMELML